MKIMLIEAPSQEQIEAIGQTIEAIGIDNLGNTKFANISYVSGIPKFDDALQGISFHNTDCLTLIIACEYGIIFALMLNNTSVLARVILMREGILDFEIERNIEVEMPRFNEFKAHGANIMRAARAIGVTISSLIEFHKNKKLNFKIISSKPAVGIKCILRYSEGSGKVGEIIYSTVNNSSYAIDFENFIKTHWTPDNQTKKNTSGTGCLVFLTTLIVISIWCFII